MATETRPRTNAPNATENEVWVNTRSGVYWKSGLQYFGQTTQRKFMTERDAVRRRLSTGARDGLLMPRNQKLTAVVTGRCVQSATPELGILIIVFDDQSTMTVKTAGIATTISAGAKMKAVLENGDQCTLQFEDGSSVTVKLADPGASVAVRDRSNAVEYLG